MKRVGVISSSVLLALLASARFAGAPMILEAVPPPYGARLISTLGVLVAAVVALLIDRLFRLLYLDGHLRRRLGRETPALMEGLITIVLLSVGVSVGLFFEAGVPFTGLITASGATAVVLGLALQEAIKDLFGGLSLNIDGSIVIGDWLTVYAEQFEEPIHGRVQGITWRSTFLALTDGRRLVIPNHVLTTHPVLNHSRPFGPKRLSVEVPIANQYPNERAMSILLGAAYGAVRDKMLCTQPEPDIILDRLDSTTTYFHVRFYSDPDKVDPHDARSVMAMALHVAILRHKMPQPVNRVEFGHAFDNPDFDTTQAREALGRTAIFKNILDDSQLDVLAAACIVRTLADDTILIHQGETDSSMFVILEGAARVSVVMEGHVRDVAVLTDGDIVGEMSLMTGAPRAATVTSLTVLRILEVTKASIEPLFVATPGLLESIGHVLVQRQSDLSEIARTPVQKQQLQHDILAQMRRFFFHAFH